MTEELKESIKTILEAGVVLKVSCKPTMDAWNDEATIYKNSLTEFREYRERPYTIYGGYAQHMSFKTVDELLHVISFLFSTDNIAYGLKELKKIGVVPEEEDDRHWWETEEAKDWYFQNIGKYDIGPQASYEVKSIFAVHDYDDDEEDLNDDNELYEGEEEE